MVSNEELIRCFVKVAEENRTDVIGDDVIKDHKLRTLYEPLAYKMKSMGLL